MISTVQLNAVSKMSLIRDTAQSHWVTVLGHTILSLWLVFSIYFLMLESARRTVQNDSALSQRWDIENYDYLCKFTIFIKIRFLWISKQQQQKRSFHCKPNKFCSWLKSFGAHRLKHLYVEVPARYFSAIQDFFYHTDSDTAKFYITSRSPNLATLSLIWRFPSSWRLKILYCFYYSSSREKLKSQ